MVIMSHINWVLDSNFFLTPHLYRPYLWNGYYLSPQEFHDPSSISKKNLLINARYVILE